MAKTVVFFFLRKRKQLINLDLLEQEIIAGAWTTCNLDKHEKTDRLVCSQDVELRQERCCNEVTGEVKKVYTHIF